jgi:predicted nuclease of predicted toxin-antitoxin system
LPDSTHFWKLLTDENISFDVVKLLRKLSGFSVETCPKGLKNGELYRKIIDDKRILLTHDKDFLESGRYPASKTSGIIFITIHPPTDKDVATAVKNMLGMVTPDFMIGKLAILTKSEFNIQSSPI